MPFYFKDFSYHFKKERFEDKNIVKEKIEFKFSEEGHTLFNKAIEAAANFPDKILPLQGVLDLEAKTIHLGALT